MTTLDIDVLFLCAAIPSIVLHEVAHGWVANKFGDSTAKRAGRLTLNPISHIDPFGTILLPILLVLAHLPAIGYAKPVPVNVGRLRKPRNQSVYVALAGPATNLILVGVAVLVCRILISRNFTENSYVLVFFLLFGIVNLFLAALNLLPIPPLDGSAVIERMVPRRHLAQYFHLRSQMLPFAMVLLIILIFTGALNGAETGLQNFFFRLLQ
jgi:Zn-dependent protease